MIEWTDGSYAGLPSWFGCVAGVERLRITRNVNHAWTKEHKLYIDGKYYAAYAFLGDAMRKAEDVIKKGSA